uniref:Uncharacterized protein n=1 Tax=Arundo donax TaxID=35708 RepID=A0A0A9B3L7_ARUDO
MFIPQYFPALILDLDHMHFHNIKKNRSSRNLMHLC